MSFIVVTLLVSLFALEIRAVCFDKTVSYAPLSIISSYPTISEPECRLECLKVANCSGMSYFNATGECFIHGVPLSTSQCSAPFEYWKRSNSGCAEGDITAGFVPDACLSLARLQPEYVVVGKGQICPGLPVEGESVARIYVVSVIFPNGTHRAFGNSKSLIIVWDPKRTSYAIRYQGLPLTVMDEPVYAATCAYIKDDASNTCACPDDIPVEATALASYADVLPIRVYPQPTVFSVQNGDYGPSASIFVRCRAGVWIYGGVPSATQYNSWSIVAGACFRYHFRKCQMVAPPFPPSRIVETAYGSVQGRRLVYQGEQQVDAFQGIPFAAPPIGELRFRKPEPPEPWVGVRQTTSFAARCIQHPKNPQDYAVNGVPSEDSLYLNVFTPCWEPPQEGFPVMVFIHGGLYLNGEAKSYGDIGICENIVTRGVVFVTIQYRLGYLGFLSTGDAVCLGNFGLWDQVAALKWHNITLVGQSAGAASVDLLHLSPHSTGLFHKAICMAGSAECRWALHPEMAAQTRQKAKRLGVKYESSEDLLEKLRKRPAEEFGCGLFSQVKEDHLDMETGPYMDGDFFPESLDALRKKAKPKPFLIGVTQEEGLFAMAGRTSSATGLADTLKDVTADCESKEAMKASLRSHFIGYASPTNPSYIRAQAGMMSDALFVAGVAEHCRKTVELQKEPVYIYVFEHFNPAIMGYITPLMPFHSATHTCELFYLFKKGVLGEPVMTDTEGKVMDIFTTALTNFAKYGDPNGSDAVNSDLPVPWDPITKQNPWLNYLIRSEPEMSDELFEGRTEDFMDIRDKYK